MAVKWTGQYLSSLTEIHLAGDRQIANIWKVVFFKFIIFKSLE